MPVLADDAAQAPFGKLPAFWRFLAQASAGYQALRGYLKLWWRYLASPIRRPPVWQSHCARFGHSVKLTYTKSFAAIALGTLGLILFALAITVLLGTLLIVGLAGFVTMSVTMQFSSMLLAISNGLCLLRAFETSISNASLSFTRTVIGMFGSSS